MTSKRLIMFSSNILKPITDKFFAGVSVTSTITKSNFGAAASVIKSIFGTDEMKRYVLPKVIVIGDESTGKSSLLEGITKCPILPRDRKICTKCPIYIKISDGPAKYVVSYQDKTTHINSKKNIAKHINDIMNNIDIISEEEIIVEITELGLPHFEYYDLPGIRQLPEDAMIMTRKICEKYLEIDNCIVLCVMPATQPRLNSSTALSLVIKHNKEADTILALTMIDRINDDVEGLLLDRILGVSDEIEELSLAGCIGIMNRTHNNHTTLVDNDNKETQWIANAFKKSELPNEYKSCNDKIFNNLGVKHLVQQLDTLYNKYIKENWKPKLIKQLDIKIALMQEEENKLYGDLNISHSHIIYKVIELLSQFDPVYIDLDDIISKMQLHKQLLNYNGLGDAIEESYTVHQLMIANIQKINNDCIAKFENMWQHYLSTESGDNIIHLYRFDKLLYYIHQHIITIINSRFKEIVEYMNSESNTYNFHTSTISECINDNLSHPINLHCMFYRSDLFNQLVNSNIHHINYHICHTESKEPNVDYIEYEDNLQLQNCFKILGAYGGNTWHNIFSNPTLYNEEYKISQARTLYNRSIADIIEKKESLNLQL